MLLRFQGNLQRCDQVNVYGTTVVLFEVKGKWGRCGCSYVLVSQDIIHQDGRLCLTLAKVQYKVFIRRDSSQPGNLVPAEEFRD